jgi:purine-nucleoside phosphorylase
MPSDDELALAEVCRALVGHQPSETPQWVIVLGSGLDAVRDAVRVRHAIAWSDLPGFPSASVAGHCGELVWGDLAGEPCAVLCGRLHCYEGYSRDQVTRLLRALIELGARRVALTNAAGGLHPRLSRGDLVVIRQHVDRLPGAARPGGRFRGFGNTTAAGWAPYDPRLAAIALQAARRIGWPARGGVYLATSGPTYETPAEARFMRSVGADVVGMSTAPEAEAAARAGASVLGLSLVTNLHGSAAPTSHGEVLETGRRAASKLLALLQDVLARDTRSSARSAAPRPER